ncbi:hypothetical protein MMC26_005015 [Xylographa opegraphella]|nr:hypothetical protein [Xylographa opegraphella]
MLSKKRQASKKSVGSVSSEKSAESRSQLDDTGNAAADVHTEAPTNVPLSPGFRLASSGTVNPLVTGPRSSLQGRPLFSDDPNTAGTVPGDASWGVETFRDSTHNLPPVLPPTDIRTVPDADAFSWPLFTTDADWEFDFEIPFTTETTSASTDASSTALNELEVSQFHNRPPPGFDPAGRPGQLIEYLSLGEKKCPARVFLDPVPSIDYSFKAIFSAQDRGLDKISSIKQDEIDRIFGQMSLVRAQPLSVDRADEQCHDGYAGWYRTDTGLMESCRAGMSDAHDTITLRLANPLLTMSSMLPTTGRVIQILPDSAGVIANNYSISNFLTMPYFDNLVKEAAGRSQGSSMSISLIDSVMAFGYQAYLTITQRFIHSEERKKADFYSRTALRSRARVLRSPNSLLKLQTILAMTTVSEQIDETIHSELLTGAVSCARALKLENRDFMHGENTGSKDRDLARRSLWYLYSIEVPNSLRRGISPALDHDWIDHAPPQACKEADWFSLQCLYAIVISSAAKMLYNQRALRQSLVEREQKLEAAYELLEDWRNHLPTPLQDIHKHNMHHILDDHQTRHIALSIFRQYHEAIFMIYFPWTGSQSDGRVSAACRRRSMELCVNSAQVVLAIANQILCLDILDSKFLDLISVSICMTFLDVATSSGAKKSISYLSMGCGIFGRLNLLDSEVPLADVLELTRTAQQMKGK